MDTQVIRKSIHIPFLLLRNGLVFTYRKGKIYLMDEHLTKTDVPVELPFDWKYRLLSRIQILSRLFRIGVRTSIEVGMDCILLQVGHKIVEFSPLKRTFSKGYIIGKQVRTLNFTKIESIKGFDNMIVFGEYLSNPLKKSVSLFRRNGVDEWSIAYTFSEGVINHIHNIIPDSYNDCVWILTGDFGHAACIWRATDNFKTVVPIFQNDQLYRSCVAFSTPDGLIYATDTPFAANSICLLYKESDVFRTKRLHEIAGSCIYGTKVVDQFIFSTVVEGDGRDETLMKLFFSKKRGKGIKDDKSHIYVGNLNSGFQDVYQVKKDILPFAFQFGTIVFPKGENNSGIIYANHVATKHNSHAVLIKINL